MATVFSIANEKGGVGKTTTAMNIGAALHKAGKKVLLIDLDQQGNLTSYLGHNPEQDAVSISDLIYYAVSGHRVDYEDCICTNADGIDYIPSSVMLATAVSILGNDRNSQTVLQRILRDSAFEKYDCILLDCRPSLDLLVVNALVASQKLIIPVQAEYYAVDGLSGLMDTYQNIRSTANPGLQICGVLVTMYDSRTNTSREVEGFLREQLGNLVFQTMIPRLNEAVKSTSAKRSLVFEKTSRLGALYDAVAEEILYAAKPER